METLAQKHAKMAETGTNQKEKLKKASQIGVMIVVGGLIILLLTVFVSNWVYSPSTASTTAPPPVHTATRTEPARAPDPCDNIAREKVLTQRPTLTSGSDNCTMVWGVEDDGGVILSDKNGKDYPRVITKDAPLGKSDFAAARWRSSGVSATVTVKYFR